MNRIIKLSQISYQITYKFFKKMLFSIVFKIINIFCVLTCFLLIKILLRLLQKDFSLFVQYTKKKIVLLKYFHTKTPVKFCHHVHILYKFSVANVRNV